MVRNERGRETERQRERGKEGDRTMREYYIHDFFLLVINVLPSKWNNRNNFFSVQSRHFFEMVGQYSREIK